MQRAPLTEEDLLMGNDTTESAPLMEGLGDAIVNLSEAMTSRSTRVARTVTKVMDDFQSFIGSKNMMEVAVGIIVGQGFSQVLNSLVDDVFLPPLTFLSLGIQARNYFLLLAPGKSNSTIYPTLDAAKADGAVTLNLGVFTAKALQFTLNAFVLFWLIRFYSIMRRNFVDRQAKEKEIEEEMQPPIPMKICPFCLEEILIKVIRCKYCTSQQEPYQDLDKDSSRI